VAGCQQAIGGAPAPSSCWLYQLSLPLPAPVLSVPGPVGPHPPNLKGSLLHCTCYANPATATGCCIMAAVLALHMSAPDSPKMQRGTLASWQSFNFCLSSYLDISCNLLTSMRWLDSLHTKTILFYSSSSMTLTFLKTTCLFTAHNARKFFTRLQMPTHRMEVGRAYDSP